MSREPALALLGTWAAGWNAEAQTAGRAPSSPSELAPIEGGNPGAHLASASPQAVESLVVCFVLFCLEGCTSSWHLLLMQHINLKCTRSVSLR